MISFDAVFYYFNCVVGALNEGLPVGIAEPFAFWLVENNMISGSAARATSAAARRMLVSSCSGKRPCLRNGGISAIIPLSCAWYVQPTYISMGMIRIREKWAM